MLVLIPHRVSDDQVKSLYSAYFEELGASKHLPLSDLRLHVVEKHNRARAKSFGIGFAGALDDIFKENRENAPHDGC